MRPSVVYRWMTPSTSSRARIGARSRRAARSTRLCRSISDECSDVVPQRSRSVSTTPTGSRRTRLLDAGRSFTATGCSISPEAPGLSAGSSTAPSCVGYQQSSGPFGQFGQLRAVVIACAAEQFGDAVAPAAPAGPAGASKRVPVFRSTTENGSVAIVDRCDSSPGSRSVNTRSHDPIPTDWPTSSSQS